MARRRDPQEGRRLAAPKGLRPSAKQATPPAAPPGLRLVARLVLLEGLGLLVIAGFYLLELAVSNASDVGRAVVTAVLVALAAVGLLFVGRGLGARRRWARAPALVVNLLALPVSVGLVQAGRWYAGVPLLLLAVAVLGLLFSKETDAALEED